MATIARCTEKHVRLNLKKPVLFKREFVGFGHKISKDGISLDTKQVAAALSWDLRAIETHGKMLSFLGSTNYLRKNIRYYADLTAPLYAVSTGSANRLITWTDPLITCFKALQQAIATAPLR